MSEMNYLQFGKGKFRVVKTEFIELANGNLVLRCYLENGKIVEKEFRGKVES